MAPDLETRTIPRRSGEVGAPRSWLFRVLDGRRTAFFWCLQLVFWGGMVLMMCLMTSFVRPIDHNDMTLILERVAGGILLSGCLREIYRHRAARRLRGWKKAVAILGLCLTIAVLEKQLSLALLHHLGFPRPQVMEYFQGRSSVMMRCIVLLSWSGFYFAFHQLEAAHALELRALQAEVAARENQLRHMQAQLNPHFLFNALNTVLASKNDPEAVEEVTQCLADYLRFSLHDTDELEPLAREIDALETYLTVQRIRFGDNLVCQITCETAARALRVPPMMIQPLLENAFNHGAETSPMPLQVKLSAALAGGFLNVTVANTGRWVPPGMGRSTGIGIGIRSLRQRLQLLIGDAATVTSEASDGWVRVTIRIPLPTPAPSKAR